MNLSIIVPCFNEEENITKLQNELLPIVRELSRDSSLELVFVDDGSTDGTLKCLKCAFENVGIDRLSIKYEQHPTNRGLGAALRTGFAAASGDVIVTTDSDGTYKFSNIPALLSLLQAGIDIVTASPYHPDGKVAGVPAYRLILSRGSSLIYRILVNWRIHTYTSMFRAYRREVIENVKFRSNGFLSGTELLVKAMLRGYGVAEYPAILYRRILGSSKAKIVRTIAAHLQFQGKILLHRAHLLSLTD